MKQQVNFYLNPKRIGFMQDGTGHQFFSRAKTAFESLGMQVGYVEDTEENRQNSVFDDAYAMFFYHDALHDHALDVRRTAIGPFYRMEKSATRAHYRLVDTLFDPRDISEQQARSFFQIWQRLLVSKSPMPTRNAVLVALQGKLLQCRSQQIMSPIDMIKTTIAHERDRPIWIKLHPKEIYTAAEYQALRALTSHRVVIYEGDLATALQGCDYIVTQNSAVLLEGVFHERPAIVFADCEFHHPFQSVRRGVPIADAFANVMKQRPDFAKFAYWYLQLNCINTSRDWAEDTIISQCRTFGWDI